MVKALILTNVLSIGVLVVCSAVGLLYAPLADQLLAVPFFGVFFLLLWNPGFLPGLGQPKQPATGANSSPRRPPSSARRTQYA